MQKKNSFIPGYLTGFKNKWIARASAFFAVVAIAGCIPESDDKSSTKTPEAGSNVETFVGFFLDSPVDGLDYVTSSGLEGITMSGGAFEYKPGDTVEFKIGKMKLGSVAAAETITPVDISKKINPSASEDLEKNYAALKIVDLLASLDNDGDLSNGINIRPIVRTAFEELDDGVVPTPEDAFSDSNGGNTFEKIDELLDKVAEKLPDSVPAAKNAKDQLNKNKLSGENKDRFKKRGEHLQATLSNIIHSIDVRLVSGDKEIEFANGANINLIHGELNDKTVDSFGGKSNSVTFKLTCKDSTGDIKSCFGYQDASGQTVTKTVKLLPVSKSNLFKSTKFSNSGSRSDLKLTTDAVGNGQVTVQIDRGSFYFTANVSRPGVIKAIEFDGLDGPITQGESIPLSFKCTYLDDATNNCPGLSKKIQVTAVRDGTSDQSGDISFNEATGTFTYHSPALVGDASPDTLVVTLKATLEQDFNGGKDSGVNAEKWVVVTKTVATDYIESVKTIFDRDIYQFVPSQAVNPNKIEEIQKGFKVYKYTLKTNQIIQDKLRNPKSLADFANSKEREVYSVTPDPNGFYLIPFFGGRFTNVVEIESNGDYVNNYQSNNAVFDAYYDFTTDAFTNPAHKVWVISSSNASSDSTDDSVTSKQIYVNQALAESILTYLQPLEDFGFLSSVNPTVNETKFGNENLELFVFNERDENKGQTRILEHHKFRLRFNNADATADFSQIQCDFTDDCLSKDYSNDSIILNRNTEGYYLFNNNFPKRDTEIRTYSKYSLSGLTARLGELMPPVDSSKLNRAVNFQNGDLAYKISTLEKPTPLSILRTDDVFIKACGIDGTNDNCEQQFIFFDSFPKNPDSVFDIFPLVSNKRVTDSNKLYWFSEDYRKLYFCDKEDSSGDNGSGNTCAAVTTESTNETYFDYSPDVSSDGISYERLILINARNFARENEKKRELFFKIKRDENNDGVDLSGRVYKSRSDILVNDETLSFFYFNKQAFDRVADKYKE